MDVPVMKVITKREQHVQMKMNAPLELTIANKSAQVRQWARIYILSINILRYYWFIHVFMFWWVLFEFGEKLQINRDLWTDDIVYVSHSLL